LPFLGQISLKLSNILKAMNIGPALFSITTLENLFRKSNDPIPPYDRSGVYKLMCKDCPAVYIGEIRPMMS